MINNGTARAPGKVVLSGEYAVLDGAPAICMAVNRHAHVVIADVDSDCSEVRAPGFTDTVGRFKVIDGSIRWEEGQASFGVVDAVLRAVGIERTGAKSIDLNTSEFVDPATQRKIGIGSSAAITVALCAATVSSADPAVLITLAQRAHASLQEGAGSGVDIASSVSGGLIEYRMRDASVTALKWPEGLYYRLLWSGVAASTREKLSKLAESVSKPSRAGLVAASESLALVWRSHDAQEVITGYRDYCQQLHQFSVDHDLGIFDAGHAELWQAANAAGLTYKPCGAGGGDIGILLGMDEAELDAFTGKYSSNCTVFDCAMSPTGVRIDA